MLALSIHLIYYVVFGISILTHSLAPLQLEHQLGGDWLISFTDESQAPGIIFIHWRHLVNLGADE